MDKLRITSDGGREETFLQWGTWPGFEDACKIKSICKTRRHHGFHQPILLPTKDTKFGKKSILPSVCPASSQKNGSLCIVTLKLLLFFKLQTDPLPIGQTQSFFFKFTSPTFNFSTFPQNFKLPFPKSDNPQKPLAACAIAFVRTMTHISLKSPCRSSPLGYMLPKINK